MYVFILLVFISEIIGTISGFGSSLLLVPLASLFFDFKTVLGITAVSHIFSNLSKIVLFRKGIRRDLALKLGLPAVFFVIIGAYITTLIPVKHMELAMNLILLVLAVYLIFKANKPLRQSERNLYVGGLLSGFVAGIAGSGGAIRGVTLAAFQLPKDIFIATSALIDLAVDCSRAVVYVSHGYLDKNFLVLLPFLIGMSFLGSYCGKQVLQKTSEMVFRYLVLVTILLTSIIQVVEYLLNHLLR
jgi:uncharacterized membrane protein YfcA